ncbi:MAG TPA: DNA-binding protein [Thiotrichaceae bacterium]|nr:DNA-binding protein [Thiotrichaceae bacterium]
MKLLTVKDLAKLLDVKPATIYSWIYQRKLPHIKLLGGRLVRFDAEDIERLLSGCKQEVEERGNLEL